MKMNSIPVKSFSTCDGHLYGDTLADSTNNSHHKIAVVDACTKIRAFIGSYNLIPRNLIAVSLSPSVLFFDGGRLHRITWKVLRIFFTQEKKNHSSFWAMVWNNFSQRKSKAGSLQHHNQRYIVWTIHRPLRLDYNYTPDDGFAAWTLYSGRGFLEPSCLWELIF